MAAMSKEEYLKKYLSADLTVEKKKKKKKKEKIKTIQPRMRIIDEDADVPVNYEEPRIVLSDDEEDDFELKPTISHMEDERPEEVKIYEEFNKSGRWKTFEGENLTTKLLVEEIIKLEPGIKEEPPDLDENGFDTKKKKKNKKKKPNVDVKKEPLSPLSRDLLRNSSVERRIKREVDSDDSPPRRRHDSDNDSSPPRRRHDSDASPVRRRHDSDASPPRRRHNSDASPPRKSVKNKSDSDASPPRKRRKDSDSDASPPRRKRANSDSDLSPPRKGGGSDSDMSPPRQGDKMAKTLDGKRAGLQRAGDLKDELLAIRRKEAAMFESMDVKVSGRFAETKVRGRAKEEEEKKRLEKEKKEVPEEIKRKFEQWNRGVHQVKKSMDQLEDNLYEMSKPLTRTEDDVDRDIMLKEQEREEDPMAEYMRKKKEKIQGKVKKLPKYSGPQPPANRFRIWPGYRWDGVVRTNGFEEKLLTKDIDRHAKEMEAYQWNLEAE
ncbi:BUD13 homolog isoform X2 [Eurytemora carolleeae]|uniref:BUD13 homolog isoform X1 n=1 Tax=Eurytemora carolleeae TaxID=1294199 RepID=UPI000C762889|nr:BUD13 homolog isoform X1 [Eurytemora carolleeae]XP_023349422.1 BUD13 homolog isoform X2 [Eurytemora carolleeae]|eukprot:XP_023349421.1 BUD13 homolog isoform X1 [Eurytemora affinis]